MPAKFSVMSVQGITARRTQSENMGSKARAWVSPGRKSGRMAVDRGNGVDGAESAAQAQAAFCLLGARRIVRDGALAEDVAQEPAVVTLEKRE